jgi:RNA polymerase sigma-70 factor (ECF subfamily)
MAHEDPEEEEESKVGTAAAFATTHWSLVLAAGDEDSSTARQALDDLCRLYWKPVYVFVRLRSKDQDDALDLTQGFFAHLLEKGLIRRANADHGRFRSYLLGCVKHYLENEHRRNHRQKRGGALPQIHCSTHEIENWLQTAAPASHQPDQLYDCACATSIMSEALRRLEAECARNHRSRLFEQLRPYLQGDAAAPDYTQTAQALGTTLGTIKVTVHRLRTRYRSLLRSVVAQTLSDPLKVDDELRALREALATGGAFS